MAFTSQTTGSPFTTPQSNITAIAYTNVSGTKRLYYASANDFTKIFCMSVTGSADTSREINVQNQGDARSSEIRGLCSDGTYLYAITGTLGNQYLHVYLLSTRAYVANHELGFHADHYARGIETFLKPGTTERRLNLLQDNIIRSYTISISGSNITLAQQTDGSFTTPTNEQVTSGNWQSIAWDSATDRLLAVAEQTVNQQSRDKVFGFQYNGVRDDREDFLPTIDGDAMTYNGDDDDLYMVHESSTNLYIWGDVPRWKPDSTSLDIYEGTTFTKDLKPLVDAGAVITARNAYTTRTGLQNAALSNGVFTWTNPPAPAGGASSQVVNLTFRATIGSNHTDHTFPLTLHAGSRTIVPPQFQSTPIPRQTVYEPYTPPPGAPTPALSHGFTVHLMDYITAGTPPYTFTVARGGNLPGTFQLTTRFVNGQPVHDTIVYNAGAVTQSVSTGYIEATVTNEGPGSSSIRIPVEDINLQYLSWHGPTDINVTAGSSSSTDLRNYLTGEPQPDIDFVGTPDTRLNAHLNNGTLTTRPDSLGSGMSPYSSAVIVKGTNILTTDNGVQRTYNVNVGAAVLPDSPPIWFPAAITIRTNRGTENRVDLNQYIQSGNPSPTFSVSAPSGVLGTIQGRIEGHEFVYRIPNSITTDTNYSVDITAGNRLDSQVKNITIVGVAETIPRLGPYQRQQAMEGEIWTFDLANIVTGQQPVTYALRGAPITGLTLTGSVLRYDTNVLHLTRNFNLDIKLTLSNALGSNDTAAIDLLVIHQVAPQWQEGPIRLEMIEGTTESWDLSRYVTGYPTPVIHFQPSFVHGILDETIQNNILTVRDAPLNHETDAFTIPVEAESGSATSNKDIQLTVYPIGHFDERITFTADDYNAIRYLLGPEVTKDDIPDAVIASDVYQIAAVDWVNSVLPTVAERAFVNLRRKRRAAVYRAAGLLSGHAPELLSESIGSSNKSFGNIDWLEQQYDLYRKARREIDTVKREEGIMTEYTFFSIYNPGGN